MEKQQKWFTPAVVCGEYERGRQHKAALGKKGIYDQAKVNERFFAGDQWNGVQAGNDKPLIRYNVIKRIGEYKMAFIGASDVAVSYSAEGVPNTQGIQEKVRVQKDALRQSSEAGTTLQEDQTLSFAERTNLIMGALSDFFKTTAERVKFSDLKNRALRNAYISGTGVLYTYWDPFIKTGLYADQARKSPIMGDIACEVLHIENVYFGDPTVDSVQGQPYIIIAQRKSVAELKRAARRHGRPASEIDAIRPDKEYAYMAGERAEDEPEDAQKATVLTKLYKVWDKNGVDYHIEAVEVVEGATIRAPWDIRTRLYPLAKFSWDERASSVYGESEVTNLIANQIAINRAVTASTWSVMMNGMPIMVVNGDMVTSPVTNEPGQVVTVYGDASDVANAIRYVTPPNASAQFENLVNSLVSNTLTHSGANEAALGDLRSENASAILARREASTMPLQLQKNRFNSFIEDVARIWAEMWVSLYGKRYLKIEDENGEWYLPFDGNEYRELIISARVDVGETGLWSEIKRQQTLDNMFHNKIVDVLQYLERLPKGAIHDLGGLIREKKEQLSAPTVTPPPSDNPTDPPPSAGAGASVPDVAAIAKMLPPEYADRFQQLSEEEKQLAIAKMMGGQ